jgi:hypothetical protein
VKAVCRSSARWALRFARMSMGPRHVRRLTLSRPGCHGSECPTRIRSVSRALASPDATLYNRIWRRSFHLPEDRSGARTTSLAWVLLGLCLSRPALAGEPASTPRATTPQVQQAVDRAIKYLPTESGARLQLIDRRIVVEHPPRKPFLVGALNLDVNDSQHSRPSLSQTLNNMSPHDLQKHPSSIKLASIPIIPGRNRRKKHAPAASPPAARFHTP